MWIEPIFDRTQADVEYANANRASPEPLKGARNYTDLNRIAGNMQIVRDLLLGLGYATPEMTAKSDWIMTDFPRESDIAKFRIDALILRALGVIAPTTPAVPDLPYTHYQKINDIEKLLFDIYSLTGPMQQIYIRSAAQFNRSKSALYFIETTTIPRPAPPVITTTALPDGLFGAQYSATLEADAPTVIVRKWEMVDGTLPVHLALSEDGIVSGQPLHVGDFEFAVKLTTDGGEATQTITLTVAPQVDAFLRAGQVFGSAGSALFFMEGNL